MSALLGALFGAITGFVSGLISEKVRGRLIAVRAELQRLDDLQDAINAACYDVEAGRPVNPSALQRVDALRTRLGQNLRRLAYNSQGWSSIEAGLVDVQMAWRSIEGAALEAEPLPNGAQAEATAATEALRRKIDYASRQFPVYRFMGSR